jgi:hypothetical protein
MSDMRWLLVALVLAGCLLLLAGCKADAPSDQGRGCEKNGGAMYRYGVGARGHVQLYCADGSMRWEVQGR